MSTQEIRGRQVLKQIHVGAPWDAEVKIEKIRYNAGRRSSIAQDFIFEVSATWTGPDIRGQLPIVSARDCATTPSYGRALEVAERAAAALRQGQVPNLPKLLPATSLYLPK